jgi:hypothetical protein
MKRLASPTLVSHDRRTAGGSRGVREKADATRTRPAIYHLMVPLALALLASLHANPASAQGQELPSIKVDLPPQPNFNITNAPEVYPTGELSIYGLRKHMNQYLDKDVQVRAYLLQIYECPAEQRKCNDELAAKNKKEKMKSAKAAQKASKAGAPPAPAEPPRPTGACRPCDQPHFFMADTPTTKIERALLVADYPLKDWNTGKPKPLVAKIGEQYVVTGNFAINSIGGFAASDGLIIHKKLVDSQGTVVTEGNAVLPPDAQDIKLEGKAVEKVGAARIDGMKK